MRSRSSSIEASRLFWLDCLSSLLVGWEFLPKFNSSSSSLESNVMCLVEFIYDKIKKSIDNSIKMKFQCLRLQIRSTLNLCR